MLWESFNCCNFGTTGPIQVGFSAKCTSHNEDFNQIENWKCHVCDFRLIPLDHITFIYLKQNGWVWWLCQTNHYFLGFNDSHHLMALKCDNKSSYKPCIYCAVAMIAELGEQTSMCTAPAVLNHITHALCFCVACYYVVAGRCAIRIFKASTKFCCIMVFTKQMTRIFKHCMSNKY